MLIVYFVEGEGFEPSEIGLKIMRKKNLFHPRSPPDKEPPHFYLEFLILEQGGSELNYEKSL